MLTIKNQVGSTFTKSPNVKNKISFGNAVLKTTAEHLAKESINLSKMPSYIRAANWFSKIGEKQGIIINAIAKASLVPFVVIFNPLSKEKKQDKVYYAWKQPIDAIITALTNIAVNIKLNKFIDKLAEKGDLGKLLNVNANQPLEVLKSAQKRLCVFKDATNLAVSVVTMPLAVLAVNWFYPRFMEKAFPKLSKTKNTGNN